MFLNVGALFPGLGAWCKDAKLIVNVRVILNNKGTPRFFDLFLKVKLPHRILVAGERGHETTCSDGGRARLWLLLNW
jgi:hypothetical protein